MNFITQLFSMNGRLGRRAFWSGWLVHLVLSIGLAALWLWVESISDLRTATLAVLPLRLPLAVQQVSVYVRRLHDAGKHWTHVLVLLLLYAAMVTIALFWALPALDAKAECQLTGYDNCGDAAGFGGFAVMAGYGVLTGLPGPLSLVFALSVGTRKTRGKP